MVRDDLEMMAHALFACDVLTMMVMNAQLLALGSLPFLCAKDTPAVLSSSSLLINQQVSLLLVLLWQQRRLRNLDSSGRPRPEQGGERITTEFLLSLSNRECVWRFRYEMALSDLELLDKSLIDSLQCRSWN